jgi:hypothetical protein
MGTHAVEVLIEDHRAVNRAFARYEDASDASDAERDGALDEIRRRLAWHVATEQQFLLPLLAAHAPDAEAREVSEHRELAALVRATLRSPAAERDPLVRDLISATRLHMESEERDLFPMLRSLIDHDELVRVGEAIIAARDAEHATPAR